ncbi:MAG: DNA-3-methyladenine glycosylase I [Malacoplasma sp.]|nr:DNA-3-methyladenine glycosylase I [Malacoplasma sp.]
MKKYILNNKKIMNNKKRCSWAKTKHYIKYHDLFWGKPNHDENYLFKLLCLETQSVGLGFSVILSKEQEYEKAFDFNDIKKISQMNENDIDKIMKQHNVIKYKAKIKAIILNAKAYFNLVKVYRSLDNYLWSKTNFKILKNKPSTTENDLSKKIAKELKKFGFKFIGSVTVFSYLQAIGIYDDHEKNCYLNTNKKMK